MRNKKAVPELVLGRPWYITEGPGAVSIKHGIFAVPLGSDAHAIAVRAHEMAHIKFSPSDPGLAIKKAGISPKTFDALEDARINMLAELAGVDLSYLYTEDDLRSLLDDLSSISPSEIDPGMGLWLASTFMVILSYHRFCSLRTGYCAELTAEIVRQFEKLLSPATPLLYQIFASLERKPTVKMVIECAKALEAIFLHGGPLAVRLVEILSQDARGVRPGSYDPEAEWLPMRVLWLPMPRQARSLSRTRRPSDFGVFRAPHRMPPVGDGLVFSIRKRVLPGGGILIDDSGSMGLKPESIVRLVEAAPLSLVAKYSADEKCGTVAVLAARGRLAMPSAIMQDFGGGNGIDGPALQWLVKNARPPYIWISDTYVTGRDDCYSEKLIRECMEIVSRFKIKICRSIDDALAYLQSIVP